MAALEPPRERVYAYPCPDPGCLVPVRQPCRTQGGRPHPLRLAAARADLDITEVRAQVEALKAAQRLRDHERQLAAEPELHGWNDAAWRGAPWWDPTVDDPDLYC